ncbi:Phosphate transport system permease protein PstC [Pseudobythopirellula maris]|uniref:Phosphate transport system permease protein n=1 Tax=Pseudobythopirellula maris TaxID=2527991 RepID=A0A5C5ZQW3_9BACT|nr:phosphate ABC transporter permease subunit PstC [Pseudobythopirellula maris]TWT89884.1 Phosphate transport system permease protein PstC [Pseudobythopirellula maris]
MTNSSLPNADTAALADDDWLTSASNRHGYERAIHAFLLACAAVSVFTTIGIVVVLLAESLQFFREVSIFEFMFGTRWTPLFSEKHFGILPLLCGSFLVTAGAILIAGPIGLGTAIYLSEYANPVVRETVKPILEVLAGIPSVVYGVMAVTTVSPVIRWLFQSDSIFNALSASVVVGFMVLPMIVSLSEDVLRAVPRDLRLAAYALGATKLQVTLGVVTPAALSGIMASFLLAISRAVGETMAVTLAAGATAQLTLNPLESVQTMTAYIVQVSAGDTPAGSLEYRTIFAVGLTLFVSTMLLNILAQWILDRMREEYE